MSGPDPREFLEIGVLTRPHGIRGEVKLRLHNEASDSLDQTAQLVVEPTAGAAGPGSGQVHRIIGARGAGRERIVRLQGVDSREAVESLRGSRVWVPRTALPTLEPGDYYLVDLIGCQLVLGEEAAGRIVALRSDPTVETLIVELPDGRRAEQPLLDAWVGAYNAEARTLELLSDDGLIV